MGLYFLEKAASRGEGTDKTIQDACICHDEQLLIICTTIIINECIFHGKYMQLARLKVGVWRGQTENKNS